MDYQTKRNAVIEQFSQVLNMNEYEMVALLQQQFNHVENTLPLTNETGIKNALRLLTEENEELFEAINDNDFDQFRDAIGDQLTILYFLLFKVAGISFTGFPEIKANKPSDYIVYTNNVKVKHDELIEAFKTANADLVQKAAYDFLSTVVTLPNGSAIDYKADLFEITVSSLGKVCRTEEIAKQTLASYQSKGYDVHIEKSEYGWVIIVSNDCIVKGKSIPKGKFLKSIEWTEAKFSALPEEKAWDKTIAIWSDLKPKADLFIDQGVTATIENKETWQACLEVTKYLNKLIEAAKKTNVA